MKNRLGKLQKKLLGGGNEKRKKKLKNKQKNFVVADAPAFLWRFALAVTVSLPFWRVQRRLWNFYFFKVNFDSFKFEIMN